MSFKLDINFRITFLLNFLNSPIGALLRIVIKCHSIPQHDRYLSRKDIIAYVLYLAHSGSLKCFLSVSLLIFSGFNLDSQI